MPLALKVFTGSGRYIVQEVARKIPQSRYSCKKKWFLGVRLIPLTAADKAGERGSCHVMLFIVWNLQFQNCNIIKQDVNDFVSAAYWSNFLMDVKIGRVKWGRVGHQG